VWDGRTMVTGPCVSHGPEWGILYADTYSAFVESDPQIKRRLMR